jgi:hypothetical protein
VKRISGRDLAEALDELIGIALSWERLDISATPYRGDLLFRSASQRMFLLQCVMGKGPLPFPVLRDLRVMPPGPGQRTAGVIADAASALRQLGGYRHAVRLYSMSLVDLFHRLGGDDPAVLEL